MNLYLLINPVMEAAAPDCGSLVGYGQHAHRRAVVRAKDEEEARNIHPEWEEYLYDQTQRTFVAACKAIEKGPSEPGVCWPAKPEDVMVKYLGPAMFDDDECKFICIQTYENDR